MKPFVNKKFAFNYHIFEGDFFTVYSSDEDPRGKIDIEVCDGTTTTRVSMTLQELCDMGKAVTEYMLQKAN